MKDETRAWLLYADENLSVAELALEHGHLNSCLQNAQQATENEERGVKYALTLRGMNTKCFQN